MDKGQIDEKILPTRLGGLVDNVHIENSSEDVLFHLGLVHEKDNLASLFNDVKASRYFNHIFYIHMRYLYQPTYEPLNSGFCQKSSSRIRNLPFF